MIILTFDTSFEACSAAIGIIEGNETVRIISRFEPMAQGHAERLVPMIGEVMTEAGVSFADIDRIGVTIGPGSFTGTRIAVATARAFALSHRVPLVGLSSLSVMAAGAVVQAADPDLSGEPILVAADVRRGEAYCQLFAPAGLSALTEPRLLQFEEAAALAAAHGGVVVGSAATAIAASAPEGAGLRATLPSLLPDARHAVILVQSSQETSASVAPLYLRPADAKPPAKAAVALQRAGGAN